jgi:hypothetical protein
MFHFSYFLKCSSHRNIFNIEEFGKSEHSDKLDFTLNLHITNFSKPELFSLDVSKENTFKMCMGKLCGLQPPLNFHLYTTVSFMLTFAFITFRIQTKYDWIT